MRKRGAVIRNRAKSAPGIVVQMVATDMHDYETRIRLSLEAFRLGYATPDHHADLAETCDLLRIGSRSKGSPDESAKAVGEIAYIACDNIMDRYERTGKVGATGEELNALQLLVDTSLDFWARRSGAMFAAAFNVLRQIKEKAA